MENENNKIREELCYCGHLRSEHNPLAIGVEGPLCLAGKGDCLKCDCERFTWEAFVDDKDPSLLGKAPVPFCEVHVSKDECIPCLDHDELVRCLRKLPDSTTLLRVSYRASGEHRDGTRRILFDMAANNSLPKE